MARNPRPFQQSRVQADHAQLYARAVKCFEAGQYGLAAKLSEQILKTRPGHNQTMLLRASALARDGRPVDARRILTTLLRTNPSQHHLHHEIALTYLLQSDMPKAHEAVDKALKASPDNPMYLAAKAELYQAQGNFLEGCAALETVVGQETADARSLIVYAELARETGNTQAARNAIDRALAQADSLTPPLERRARFAHISILDQAGEYLEAFDAATVANERAIELRGMPFDGIAHHALVNATIATWTQEKIASLPARGERSDLPVFIVGMPRSGTSLVEQIIASHPLAHGAGELAYVPRFAHEMNPRHAYAAPIVPDPDMVSPAKLSRFARSTLRELRKLGSGVQPIAQRVTDKNPLNFLNLGLIGWAFPSCRIIHCQRDPLDTCVSCFFHDFKGDLRCTNQLDTLGEFVLDHDRLMAHWNATLNIPILTVSYEDLVHDFHAGVERLLAFLDLPFDEACLEFYKTERMAQTASMQQVREPIYTKAVGRAARYGDRLDPLRAILTKGATDTKDKT